jgi:hypothetical protein
MGTRRPITVPIYSFIIYQRYEAEWYMCCRAVGAYRGESVGCLCGPAITGADPSDVRMSKRGGESPGGVRVIRVRAESDSLW